MRAVVFTFFISSEFALATGQLFDEFCEDALIACHGVQHVELEQILQDLDLAFVDCLLDDCSFELDLYLPVSGL